MNFLNFNVGLVFASLLLISSSSKINDENSSHKKESTESHEHVMHKQHEGEHKELAHHEHHVSGSSGDKRAITEWRFKRLSDKISDIDDMFDINLEMMPKAENLDGNKYEHPLRFKIKLVPVENKKSK